MIANIDGYWRFIWLLISELVGIDRGARKLIQTLHMKKKKRL
jgi:hypothetical protein